MIMINTYRQITHNNLEKSIDIIIMRHILMGHIQKHTKCIEDVWKNYIGGMKSDTSFQVEIHII